MTIRETVYLTRIATLDVEACVDCFGSRNNHDPPPVLGRRLLPYAGLPLRLPSNEVIATRQVMPKFTLPRNSKS